MMLDEKIKIPQATAAVNIARIVEKQPILSGEECEYLSEAQRITTLDLFPKSKLLKLHHLLGDDLEGPALPDEVNHDLKYVRQHLTTWVLDYSTDEEAYFRIESILVALTQ